MQHQYREMKENIHNRMNQLLNMRLSKGNEIQEVHIARSHLGEADKQMSFSCHVTRQDNSCLWVRTRGFIVWITFFLEIYCHYTNFNYLIMNMQNNAYIHFPAYIICNIWHL